MKITPRTMADLWKLGALPGARRIFLHREYERQENHLKKLAAFYRKYLLARTRFATVVGSLGKTTTRRAIAAALDCPNRNFSNLSYGSNLAVNLLRIRRHDRYAVIEAAISSPGQMEDRAKLIRPDLAVVTSIKSEHSRSFATLLDTREEKVKMVRALTERGIAILNGDDDNVRWMATQTRARVVTFGMNADNDIRATKIDFNGDGSSDLEIQVAGARYKFRNPLAGQHMVYPVLAAVAVAHVEKIEMTGVFPRLAKINPVIGRMEWMTLSNGIRILDDSFKSTRESIDAAFETLSKIPATRRIVVMGRIEETIGKERDSYRELGTRLAQFADLILCIGGGEVTSLRAAAVKSGMSPSSIKHPGSRIDGAREWLQSILRPGDVVLIKGASHQKLRRIALELLGKTVTCHAKRCDVIVCACDNCPLLNAPESFFQNSIVSRYIEL
jgi:UDP-N-acetylmuramyl pentapeptide synthase